MSGLLERIARRRRAASKERPAPDPAPQSPAPATPVPAPEVTPTPTSDLTRARTSEASTTPTLGAPAAREPGAPAVQTPDFRERGSLRRRARYLRALREIQLRDLGGLLVELHRFGRERPDLVEAKVAVASNTSSELRALDRALRDRRSVRELREPGVGGTCVRCGAVHGSSDRFCASCGAPLGLAPDLGGEPDEAARAQSGASGDRTGPGTQRPEPAR